MKRFSKSIFLTILVIAMAIALVGCKTASVSTGEVVEPAPVEPAPVEPAPAEPAPAPAEPAPAPAEPAPAPAEPAPAPAPAEPVVTPIRSEYKIGDYTVDIVAGIGTAKVTYPVGLFTEEELLTALNYAVTTYPALVDYVVFDYKPGEITFTYPEDWGEEDFAIAEEMILAYVNGVLEGYGAAKAEKVELTEVQQTEPESLHYTLSLYGYKATIDYMPGVAVIRYPEILTNEEVIAAAELAYEAYAPYLEGTTLLVDKGMATLLMPYELTEEDVDFAVGMLAAELNWYVGYLFGTPAETTAPVVSASKVITKHVDIMGYDATVTYSDCVATIEYPAFITNAEVADAARLAYASFGKYLEGTTLDINNGTAVLTFPQEITEADLDYAIALLQAEIPAYVAAITKATEPVAQPVATVAEQPAEKPAEQPAEPAPAATTPAAPAATTPAAPATTTPAATETKPAATETKPAATTTTATTEAKPAATTPAAETKPAASTTTSTAAPAAAKKSNVGLIIVIVLLVLAAGAACFILLKKKKK